MKRNEEIGSPNAAPAVAREAQAKTEKAPRPKLPAEKVTKPMAPLGQAPLAKARSPLPKTQTPPPEVAKPKDGARALTPEELLMERDRIYARLTSIPNVISRPSPADYVVFEVADPNVAHKKLVALGVPADVVQKYPKVTNGMRVFVRSARQNEEDRKSTRLNSSHLGISY